MIRHQRLKPNRANLNKPWLFTKNDELILTYLARYRYLRGTTIHQLVDGKPGTVNYCLRKLYDRRLIDKPSSQGLGYNSLNDTDIYEILPRGYAKLIEKVPEATNLIRKVTDAPVKNFSHSMMICDALASLELGARAAGCTFMTQGEILAKVDGDNPMKLPCSIKHKFPNGTTQALDTFIIPDGVFAIGYPNGRTRLFLLEAEHYNPLNPTNIYRASFLKKILAYTDIKAKKAIRQLGKSSFNVLFVFPTKTRSENAMAVVEAVLGQSELFLLSSQPVQEEIWKSPDPYPELFNGLWLRGGHPPFSIKETPAT